MELLSGNTIPNQNDDLAGTLIREWGQLFSSRGIWETHWQEIAELVFPTDSRSFQGQLINQGEKRAQQKLYDSTANTALARFMAIMDSLLTPHNQKWHSLHTDDPILNRNRSVRQYYDEVTNILFRERYLDTANFIEHNQQVWTSLGAYGTGALFIDQLWGNPGIRYKYIHLGEMYFSENHQGVPDTVYRHYRLTARQAVQKFREDMLPEIIVKMAKSIPETLYEFLHVVKPRYDFDPNRKDEKGMPFASYDVSITGNKMVSPESGYRSFPYAISRYTQSLQEVYGRSPAMDVLPTIKTLNEEKKAILKQAHRITDPMYLVHDDGDLPTMSAKPGTVIAGGVSAEGKALVHTLATGNTQIGQEIMQDDRSDIKDAFLVSLFQILAESNSRMTAQEVIQRTKEKGILIAPTMGRQETYLSRVINREIDLLNQQRRLPPMPTLLKQARGQYKIRYESPLARMRQAESISGLMNMIQTATQITQSTGDPSPMYFFNWDSIMPDVAEAEGLPYRWINDVEKVQAMRASAQQQKNTENAIQAGPAAAAVLKATQGA